MAECLQPGMKLATTWNQPEEPAKLKITQAVMTRACCELMNLLQVRRDSIGWLASCHHRQLSLTEIDTLNAHTQALEDTDEDFFDNFS